MQALDIEKNKKNRVTATQFASEEAIAHTSHSPQFDSIIDDEGENVKQMFSVADAGDSWGVDWIGKENGPEERGSTSSASRSEAFPSKGRLGDGGGAFFAGDSE